VDCLHQEIDHSVNAPAKSNHRNPVPHDRAKYKWRNLIKLLNKLKSRPRVATRYD
jgi:hypothetical protein